MKAFILCGGFGTRLRATIGNAQKAVTEVSGEPFLWNVIDQLALAGLTDLVFCSHFQSQQVEQALARYTGHSQLTMQVVRESAPLGTAGAVIHAIASTAYGGPLLVLNGDTYLAAEGYHAAAQAAAPAILVTAVDDCARYGAIRIDSAGRVLGLIEKGVSGPGLISAGVYKLDRGHLPVYASGPLSIEKEVIPPLISQGILNVARYQGPFIDIGTPESLKQIRSVGVKGIQ